MAKLNVGDRVLECTTWTPAYKGRDKTLGEGVVTVIVEVGDDERKLRVLWEFGDVGWHLEKDLVNINRVIRYNSND